MSEWLANEWSRDRSLQKVVKVRMPFARLSVFTRAQENRRSTVHEW